MFRHGIIAILLIAPAPILAGETAGKTIECYCTDAKGARVEIGDVICLSVGGRDFLAQCDMSQNVPAWRDIGEGCLSSRAAPSAAQSVLQILKPPV